MYRKWIALGVLVPVVVASLLIASPLLLSVFAPRGRQGPTGVSLSSYMEAKQSDILAMAILGNSTDYAYPELMHAIFLALDSGTWNTTATFVDDSNPSNVTTYNKVFEASVAEVQGINDAIYTGLASCTQSPDSLLFLLPYVCVGFGIDVLYKDGTWIQLFTLLDIRRHLPPTRGNILFVNGTYTGTPNPADPFGSVYRDVNWLNGCLLEPAYALDGLVTAIHNVFENHLGS
jgi:hypothetical protein